MTKQNKKHIELMRAEKVSFRGDVGKIVKHSASDRTYFVVFDDGESGWFDMRSLKVES